MLTFSNCHQFYTYTWINSGEHTIHKALHIAICSGAGAGQGKAAWLAMFDPEREMEKPLIPDEGKRLLQLPECITIWDQQLYVGMLLAHHSFPNIFTCFQIILYSYHLKEEG